MTTHTAATTATVTTRPRWDAVLGVIGGALLLAAALSVILTNDAIPVPAFLALYFPGIALAAAAGFGMGRRVAAGALGVALGIGLAVFVVLWIMGLGDSLKGLVDQFDSRQHVRDHVPVAVLGTAWLMAASALWRRDTTA